MQRKADGGQAARPVRAEVGVLVDRLRELGRRRRPPIGGDAAQAASADGRIEMLEQRIHHLESMLEGLQDAVDRQVTAHAEQLAELRKRTQPAELARALSEDARRRGI